MRRWCMSYRGEYLLKTNLEVSLDYIHRTKRHVRCPVCGRRLKIQSYPFEPEFGEYILKIPPHKVR